MENAEEQSRTNSPVDIGTYSKRKAGKMCAEKQPQGNNPVDIGKYRTKRRLRKAGIWCDAALSIGLLSTGTAAVINNQQPSAPAVDESSPVYQAQQKLHAMDQDILAMIGGGVNVENLTAEDAGILRREKPLLRKLFPGISMEALDAKDTPTEVTYASENVLVNVSSAGVITAFRLRGTGRNIRQKAGFLAPAGFDISEEAAFGNTSIMSDRNEDGHGR